MALINCKECGSKISDKAPACVHCGGPLAASAAPPSAAAPKKKAKPWPLWAALLMVGTGLVFGAMNPEAVKNLMPLTPQDPLISQSPPKPQNPPKPPTPQNQPASLKAKIIAPPTSSILVSAVHLSKDYKTNATSADMNYKGERLIVNGVIDSINKTPVDAPYVALSGGAASKAVHAQFPKVALNKLAALKSGQTITVACTGGGMLTGSPVLKGCTIFSP